MNAVLRAVAAILLLAAAAAAAQPAAPLAADVAETLRWFPADVDALLVTADFKLADASADWSDPKARDAWLAQDPVPQFFRAYATGRIHRHTDGGVNEPSAAARELRARVYVERIDQFWAAFADRQVQFAVLAAREVVPISAFGSCGYAGCHVVRLAEPLDPDAAGEVAEQLRAGADSVIKHGDREIAVFNWTFPKEPYIKTRPWEGLFIVVPQTGDQELLNRSSAAA